MDSIPIIFEFTVETYVPVVNATNNNPIKLSEEYIIFFDKICKYRIFLDVTSIDV